MTKTEDVRLAVVETKIDNICDDITTIKRDIKVSNDDIKVFMSGIVAAQEKAVGVALSASKEAINIAMMASKEAILKAENANNEKFETYNAELKIINANQAVLVGAKSGVKEFIGYILAAITILGFIISQFVGR